MNERWMCLAAILLLAVPGLVQAECPTDPEPTQDRSEPCGSAAAEPVGTASSGGEFQLRGRVDQSRAGLRVMGGGFELTVSKGVDLPSEKDCSCLCFGLIFGDGFESGDTSEWSGSSP